VYLHSRCYPSYHGLLPSHPLHNPFDANQDVSTGQTVYPDKSIVLSQGETVELSTNASKEATEWVHCAFWLHHIGKPSILQKNNQPIKTLV